MGGKIFVNYRRGDDPGFVQALFGQLEQNFSRDQLFIDVDHIAPGLDFVAVLDDQVAQCDVMLAMIGRGWLDAKDAAGQRRLDDADDFVRVEIASALRRGKRVIPVLVNEAAMPRATELPEELKPLARCNAVRLTHERFRADTLALIKGLKEALAHAEVARLAAAAKPEPLLRKTEPPVGVSEAAPIAQMHGASVPGEAPEAAEVRTARPIEPKNRPRREFRTAPAPKGLALPAALPFVLIAVCAGLASVIAPFDPATISLSAILKEPSSEHLLGTDTFGRDILSRVLFALRVSVAASAVTFAVLFVLDHLTKITGALLFFVASVFLIICLEFFVYAIGLVAAPNPTLPAMVSVERSSPGLAALALLLIAIQAIAGAAAGLVLRGRLRAVQDAKVDQAR